MADPSPPPPRFRWDWGEFAFTTMANAAGTLVAAAVIYLGGVVAGAWRANPFIVVASASLLVLAFLQGFFVMRVSRWAASRYLGRDQP